jgi:hypothetical protein
VLKISRYYFLDNFMENFQKIIFQINLQFSVFTHIAQRGVICVISNISDGFSENRQRCINFSYIFSPKASIIGIFVSWWRSNVEYVLNNLKLLFMCGSAVIYMFRLHNTKWDECRTYKAIIYCANIVSIFY